jgi:hypothetical protein
VAGRQVLEDGLGVRWADVHPGPRQSLTLALPAKPWGAGVLFVESLADNSEYQVTEGSDVDLARVKPEPRGFLPRGALHEAFALLFALPFDVSALTAPPDPAATVASDGGANLRIDRRLWTRKVRRATALATGAAGVAAFAAAGGLAWSAAGLRQDAQNADGSRRATLNDELARRNAWTLGTLAGGGLLAAAAAALLVWDRPARE